MTQSDAGVIERTDDVLDIVLNRPEQRNAGCIRAGIACAHCLTPCTADFRFVERIDS